MKEISKITWSAFYHTFFYYLLSNVHYIFEFIVIYIIRNHSNFLCQNYLNIFKYLNKNYPTPVRFESNVSAHLELSINCTMAWVADRQVRAMLYATLAVS